MIAPGEVAGLVDISPLIALGRENSGELNSVLSASSLKVSRLTEGPVFFGDRVGGEVVVLHQPPTKTAQTAQVAPHSLPGIGRAV